MSDGLGQLPAPAAYWRLAIIFDAIGRDRGTMEAALTAAMPALRAIVGGAGLRVCVAEHFNADGGGGGADFSTWRENDGAIEITVGAELAGALPEMAAKVRTVFAGIADPLTIEGMAGPCYFMVPARQGDMVLSLSFRRDPATSKADFLRWWHNRHAKVAVPVLGDWLLAYDQVHCDDASTEAVAAALGVPVYPYDAYDNLTWANWEAFLASTADPDGGRRIADDEIGRIDNNTRRHGLMRPIGGQ